MGGLLFVLPWELDAPGGVNQVVANLAEVSRRTGAFRPYLLVNSWDYAHPAVTSGGAMTVIRYRLPPPYVESKGVRSLLAFLLRLPSTLFRLGRLLRKNGIAAVNVHYPSPAALHFCALRAMKAFPGKVVLSVHGADISGLLRLPRLERFLWRRLLRCASWTVACSNALAAELAAFYPAASRRIVSIHNGVDPALLREERDASFVPAELEGVPFLLSVGTFEHKKGQDVLLDAFRAIAAEFPLLHLVIVGRSGDCAETLRARATEYGLGDRVKLYTDVPHARIGAFFERATLFCLPSRAEPFGIVLLEAAIFGVPVVASRVGGVPEIVRDGLDGRLVEPEDPSALAAVLAEVLRDARLRESYAASLSQRVRREFTWDRAFQKYLELMRIPSR